MLLCDVCDRNNKVVAVWIIKVPEGVDDPYSWAQKYMEDLDRIEREEGDVPIIPDGGRLVLGPLEFEDYGVCVS